MMMADRQVRIIISASVEQALRGMRDVEGGLGRVGNAGRQAESQTSTIGSKLSGALGAAGVVGGFALVVGGFKSIIDQGREYEANMNTLQAVTGANAAQMKALGDKAKQLGNDVSIPGASAATAADAMKELAKGGLSVEESMTAAAGTLRLAAAAQVSGGQAAQIQANALNAFRLSADSANHVADLLANGANAASGEVTDMAAALQQAGTVASGFGLNIDETTTSLGLFAKNGIIGSDAGTSLKTMLTALASPTVAQANALDTLGVKAFDASGKFIGMETITKELANAHAHLTTEQYASAASTAFGTDAVRAANILGAEGTDGWNKMATAVGKAGGAQELAAAQSQGLNGAMDRLNNAASTAALAVYEQLAPALSGAVDLLAKVATAVGDAIGWFGELPAPLQAGALALGALILLKGPVLALWTAMKASGVGLAIQGEMLAARLSVQSLRLQAQLTGGSMGLFSASMRVAGVAAVGLGNSLKAAFLSNPIGIGLVAATTALSFFMSRTDDAANSTDNLGDAIDKTTGKLTDSAAAMFTDSAVKSGAAQAYKALGGNVSDLVDKLGGIPGAGDKVDAVLQKAKDSATAAGTATDSYGSSSAATADILKNTAAVTGFLSDGTGKLGEATKDASLTSEGLTGALGAQGAAATGAAGATGELTQAQELAKDPAKFFADALKAAADNAQTLADNDGASVMLGTFKTEADKASRAADLFKIALDTLDGRSRSLDDATADQQKTLSALASAWKDGTKAATDNAAAGNLNTQALTDWNVKALTSTSDGAKLYDELGHMADQHLATASAAYSDAVAHGDVAGAAGIARQSATDGRKAFVDLATQYLGGNVPAAEALADKLGIVDGTKIDDKFFQTINDDADAQAKLKAAQAAVINDKLFTITADAATATAEAQNLNQVLKEIDGKKVTWAAVGSVVVRLQDLSGTSVLGTGAPTVGQAAVRAEGGWISGPGGPKEDKVKARLSPGEFVVNAAQAGKHGGLLEAINDGTMGFADGGPVPAVAATDTGAAAAVAVQGAVSVPDVNAIETAWAAISAAVQTAWATIIQPALDALSVATLRTSAEFLALQTDSVEPSWAANSAAIANAVDGIILPTYAALNAATDFVAADMHALFDGSIAPVWTGTGQLISDTWAGPIQITYGALNAGSNAVGATFGQLAATTATTWGQIGSTINATYTGQIVPAWDGVQGFTSAAGGFFTGVQSGVSTATGQITGDIAKITTAIDDFFGMVDSKAPATTTPTVTASLGGGLQVLADGGLLSGPGGPREDKLVIRASPGEFVVNAKATAEHLPELTAINNGGAFADGGLVGDKISGSIQSAITTGAQKAITAGVDRVVAASTGGVSTASGFNASQDPSSFGWVRASNIDTGYAWQGHPVAGGVAQGTEGLWNALLSALVPQIPGGLNETMYGYENRNNVNNPGVPSFHSYGLAVDVNASSNPNGASGYGRSGNGVIPSGVAHSLAAQLGMEWGGDFGGTPDPMHFEIHVPPGGISSAAGAGTTSTAPAGSFLQSILDRIKSGAPAAGAAPAPVGGGVFDPLVERWRSMVEQTLAFIKQPISLANTVLNQMRTESSGNENAINLTDVNAQRGDPSIGLIQVIGDTFRNTLARHGLSSLIPRGQRDPFANLVAGELYSIDRYGSIAAGMQGHAYDNGGTVPPGFTMAYNGTGQNEMTLTNSQWQTARSATLGVGNSSGATPMNVTVNNYLDGTQIDSRTEVIVDGKMTQLGQTINRMTNQVLV